MIQVSGAGREKHSGKSDTSSLAEKKCKGLWIGSACKGKFPKQLHIYLYYFQFCNIVTLAALIFEKYAYVTDGFDCVSEIIFMSL